MRTKYSFGVLMLLGLTMSTAKADCLFYDLPEDHTWVRFEMQLTIDQQTNPATLTMASVGQVSEGGEQCRWIEFKLQMTQGGMEHTIIAKALIPESYLKKGESPMDHLVRGWLKQG